MRGELHVWPPSDDNATLNGKRFNGELFQTATISFEFDDSRQREVGVLCPVRVLGFGADHDRPPS
jgi:hypothetical protein